MAYKTWDSLPEILVAQDISDFLFLSRRRVYELFNIPISEGGIPNFEVGNSKRADKSDFKKWIQERKEEKSKKVG
ncbi:MAG: helix-turn-helix domain-containing protein [Bacillus sp. (in: Bacteria)]|nr:helix-turn-helix domain-containing protein [Bacillus sp. (in: firmicutes)]